MKGAHRQAHARANGRWAIYWYAWRGGPQIAAYVGATRAEAEALEEAGWQDLATAWADATRATPAKGLVARVVAEYRAHDSYKALKPATRATYTVWLDRIVRSVLWPIFKPPALYTIDDRAHQFDGTWPAHAEIAAFKPWNKRHPILSPQERGEAKPDV